MLNISLIDLGHVVGFFLLLLLPFLLVLLVALYRKALYSRLTWVGTFLLLLLIGVVFLVSDIWYLGNATSISILLSNGTLLNITLPLTARLVGKIGLGHLDYLLYIPTLFYFIAVLIMLGADLFS